MSQKEPTECYVYQPGPSTPRDGDDPKIFGLGGPGSDRYRERRYTRKDADRICSVVNAKLTLDTCGDRIVQRLEEFTRDLESGVPISSKYRIRKVKSKRITQ